MKKWTAIVFALLVVFLAACSKKDVDKITYALYPYLPDVEYYQEIVEQRWAELEPDIELVRVEWDCYEDSEPDGVDVFMYDSVTRDKLIGNGWIRSIDRNHVQDAEDVFSYALDGLTVEGELYGVPVFLCGNFLIYDADCAELVGAKHLTDLAHESEMLVINSRFSMNRPQYIHEILADTLREANPIADEDADAIMTLVDQLAIDAHEQEDDAQVALSYDSGIGKGYIGFSESMRLLNDRISRTGIKTISFSEEEDLPRVYVDAVAVNSKEKGRRYEKCVELMNVIAEADALTALSVHGEEPQYLLVARKSPYSVLAERYPLYAQLEVLASDENNTVILGPAPTVESIEAA